MKEGNPTFEEIDELTRELNLLFSSLTSKIAHLDSSLRSLTLDHMYGNLTEALYAAQMRDIEESIAKFKNLLLTLREADVTFR
jgi:hypothetical protein